MKIFDFRRDWLAVLLALAPFGILALVWKDFPAQIPMHFGIDGAPDRYSSNKMELLLLPCLNVFLFVLLAVLPTLDPKKPKMSESTLQSLKIGMLAFMTGIFGLVTYIQLSGDLRLSGKPLFSLILLLFVFLGNLFGKVRPNYFIGIRTPWTLESETSWRKTHWLAGKLWVFGSLLMLPLCWLLPNEIFVWMFLAFVALIVVVPVAASWRYAQVK